MTNAEQFTDALYELSKSLALRNPEKQSHGFLGGEFGYGQEFKNDVFEMRPYYWGDCTCGADETDEGVDHTKECALMLPNFKHYASGVELEWYKYIGRGMKANKDVGMFEFCDIIKECIESIKKYD